MRKIFFIISLLLTLSLAGCKNADTETLSLEEQKFLAFADTLFVQRAASDSLTLNYTLTNPENCGIVTLPDGFYPSSFSDLEKNSLYYENLYSQAASVDASGFSTSGKLLHDILLDTLETQLQGQNYLAFTEALGPVTGIQAQLPVLLAEFRIKNKENLEQYFLTIQTLPEYFQSLLSIEQEKNKRHTLLCRDNLRHIIDQCRSFLEQGGISMLEKTFETRIKACDFLSEEEQLEALKKHSACMNQHVHPAYQALIRGLQDLLPSAGTNGSLSSYPNGKEYYRYLVHETTGSSLSVEELKSLMTTRFHSARTTLLAYAQHNPSLFSTCDSYITRYLTPEKILSTLQTRMRKDFPPLKDTSCEIKYVDAALKNYLSPAFYLVPPIDDSSTNVIYINPSDSYDIRNLFNTLAHEGYPGHLYQTCYLQNKKYPRLRYLLHYGGYTEGWASYAEIYAYKYTGVSKDEVGILRNNQIASLCLYGLCDIGVHFDGWSEEELFAFLNKYGSYDKDSVSSLYAGLIDEPASYLKYTVGYLEICRLKNLAKDLSGENYSEMAFHTFMLDTGPAPFDIFQEYFQEYISENG